MPEPTLPGWYVRAFALAVFLACGTILGVAVYLQPDARGFGTHEQLPFQGPCGFLLRTGYPCPTCGMTTAFAHTVRGQWLSAMKGQPAGFVLALATFVVWIGSGYVLLKGRLPRWQPLWLTPFRIWLGLLILLIGGWALMIVIGLAGGTLPYRPGGG